MKFGILGSGSWGTALAKLLTDNGNKIAWWNRSEQAIEKFKAVRHNPQYLTSARFDMNLLELSTDPGEVIAKADVLLIAVPSAYVAEVFDTIAPESLAGKKILSAVKGILPDRNELLNDFLKRKFNFPVQDYFAVLGPCHAEEVAAEKLSYLTFTGVEQQMAERIAASFRTDYLNTIVNRDIYGVQYAAVLKNIYAVGAGMAHGLDYGDNFLSVLIANSADEMAGFLRKAGIINAEVGYIDHKLKVQAGDHHVNYAASVYLGDLLVTCYSLFSRNRSFGNMVGKGYSVKSAQLEMSMVAEGYNASRCMHMINLDVMADMPVAETIYNVLWNDLPVAEGFQKIEGILI